MLGAYKTPKMVVIFVHSIQFENKYTCIYSCKSKPVRLCNDLRHRLGMIDQWFKPRSGKTKDYSINVCCFRIKELEQRLVGSDLAECIQNEATYLPMDCFSELAI